MAQQRFVVAGEDRGWVEKCGWRSAEDVLTCASGGVAAVSRSSDVVHVPIDESLGGPGSVFVKRYLYKRRSQRIKQMFRGTLFGKSRARTEYEFLQEMCSRHVPTVRPIAYGEMRKGGLLRGSFIITEGMEGGRSLDILALHARRNKTMTPAAKMALIRGLAMLVRGMHDAGVQHGGLYWRNILVHALPQDKYAFALLDPASGGRLSPSPVPLEAAVKDLSQFVASAMALDMRGGLRSFMCAYFQVNDLTSEQRRVIARLVENARLRTSQERSRMAVAEATDWFRNRATQAQRCPENIRRYESLDEFFDLVRSCEAVSMELSKKKLVFHLSFADVDQTDGNCQRSVLIEGGRVTLSSQSGSKPDMVIRTDSQTWLAVLSGRPDAYAHLRAGRLRLHGDTRLLPTLVAYIDKLSHLATPNAGK